MRSYLIIKKILKKKINNSFKIKKSPTHYLNFLKKLNFFKKKMCIMLLLNKISNLHELKQILFFLTKFNNICFNELLNNLTISKNNYLNVLTNNKFNYFKSTLNIIPTKKNFLNLRVKRKNYFINYKKKIKYFLKFKQMLTNFLFRKGKKIKILYKFYDSIKDLKIIPKTTINTKKQKKYFRNKKLKIIKEIKVHKKLDRLNIIFEFFKYIKVGLCYKKRYKSGKKNFVPTALIKKKRLFYFIKLILKTLKKGNRKNISSLKKTFNFINRTILFLNKKKKRFILKKMKKQYFKVLELNKPTFYLFKTRKKKKIIK